MPIQSSFPKVADQIIAFNKNIVEVLSKLNSLTTSKDSEIPFSIIDDTGKTVTFTIPSNSYLMAEIERLNNNINQLYAVDNPNGTLIQNSKSAPNAWKKIITVDLNVEPQSIQSLDVVTSFKTDPNWFFDSLLDPMLSVEFDLQNKIENNVRKVLSRRYIVNFEKNANGDLTTLGQSALESFNANFLNNPNIAIAGGQGSFENWHKTTPGVTDSNNPRFDEQIFDLEPNSLQFDGIFNVTPLPEDTINKKKWYQLDTLNYSVIGMNEFRQLAVGDVLLTNTGPSNQGKFRIIEISTTDVNPKIRLEKIEGIGVVSAGYGALKLFSPVNYTKKVRISVGYNERNVLFLKPINAETNLLSKNWSLGTGYYTNDLKLSSGSSANGLSLEQFFIDYVYDYGQVLKDLVAKKTPNSLASPPNTPVLNADNFKVVQINQHLTDTPDANLLKQKHNIHLNLKAEIQQLQTAVEDKNKKIKVVKFKSDSEKKKAYLEINDLNLKLESKFKQSASISTDIINISKLPNAKIQPKYRVRGFWSIPESVVAKGTKPQEIVQFRVQYKYVSKDGKETPVEIFQIDGVSSKGAFSNWNEMKTDARKRGYDSATGEYFWKIENTNDPDTPNINQLDLDITQGERIDIRVKSISEVGWPDSPVESDWSEVLSINFPDDLNNVLNETDFILKEASKEELKVSMKNELSSKGLDDHLSEQITIDNKLYVHDSSSILSGFKDSNGNVLNLYEYLQSLQDKIKTLEDKLLRAQGELEVIIFRNNQEFVVENGSETVFNIECEDYLETYTAQGVPTGRVYQNNIYVIKDFVLKIRNKSTSPLGLLSNRTYLQNSGVYNTAVPQCFWVNDKDELMTSEITGSTKTQIDNQFIWSVNYDSVTSTSVNRLSQNIGNAFSTNNSITQVLSNTEFNLGYGEISVLNFVGNNKSLLEPQKWIDNTTSVASTTKLLTTIHPVVQNLEKVTELNSEKVKTVNAGEQFDIVVPLNIYFKMNALDTNQSGLNYQYINLNGSQKTVKHIKKLKFLLENEAENRPFTFSLKFNINRNKIILKKISQVLNTQIK